MKLDSLKPLLSGHYILNPIACLLYVILRCLEPFCGWLFPGEECQISWRDFELLSFLMIVLAVKNRKWKPDLRLGLIYLIICLVLFLLFPEPSYSGPDEIFFFRGPALDDALRDNPSVTWLVEFYAPWCPPCVRFAPTFAELSLRYNHSHLRFGKLDVGKYPIIAQKYKVDESVISKQLPSLILFEGGKETKRRPLVDRKRVITPYTFTEVNIERDFNLKELKKSAEDRQKLEEKNSKKTKNKDD
ncbi:thioredoxin-related transmembrane protein 2-B-like isoform X2 [Stylophora pistillata]|uniref:thioredoxin-related transmembrane protein 2-B-like isoform X2 n=1 Tax=Stylophora pistillata TaxID=50429 RepID=UPI000C03CB81|nr:thioredoxin-related transmembrane protein 2-B-like isoform X2 [Stylophora pistillata]